ncbi:MAG: thioesterase family protein [Aquidulcibacter sp.]|uniref:acyl-CoA thioesterase domain-containing protein n=1 Tax=Aquidulcibacter sp. TaxID=2052990 RepID=UPI0022C8208E|nr:acyl-CoA thioesterase domain-containing protein [Aquidulcibacter sp.]MCZ8209621.1 thioesterase family protein [Aquidulcibacter sp.]
MTSSEFPSLFEEVGRDTFRARSVAAGPFFGIQGGAVGGLLASMVHRNAPAAFIPLSIRIDFLRPTPLDEPLLVGTSTIQSGNRMYIGEATLMAEGRLTARAIMSLARTAPLEALPADYATEAPLSLPDLLSLERSKSQAPHGRPWFMDVLDARAATDGSRWFRPLAPVLPGSTCTAFERMLGPVDFAHGMARPGLPDRPPVSGWPNADLSVHVFRQMEGEWIGMRPLGNWSKLGGLGIGTSALYDAAGQFGRVTMSVIIIP